MVEISGNKGVYLLDNEYLVTDDENAKKKINYHCSQKGINHYSDKEIELSHQQTISHSIIEKHTISKSGSSLGIKFDSLASHDITYVGIIQTAKASGLKKFPMPYILTNCHNSLAAVGGTINEDDHAFGLSAAIKYGGIYVPPHQAVIHQYIREMIAGCEKMILGSDSHTRYGALGTMGIGEGGPELVKQLLGRTYEMKRPETILVYLENSPKSGVGPQDVALSIIGSVFDCRYVNNKIMEFTGPGVKNLSVEYRCGIDVMTTETTCLSSIWMTDDQVKDYYSTHGRGSDYKTLHPGSIARYNGLIRVDLSKIEPMIAMPFHPSNIYTVKDVVENPGDVFNQVENQAKKQFGNQGTDRDFNLGLMEKMVNGKVHVDQGIIAGCAGGSFENLAITSEILQGKSTGDSFFSLSVYPASQPVNAGLIKNGYAEKLVDAGAVLRTAFCGPCFGAGDVPLNKGFSIRHATRNFPNREGAKPGQNQIASVALMDARSIAATALNKGVLTPATNVDMQNTISKYTFNSSAYRNRVCDRYGSSNNRKELKFGPNIVDWPKMITLPDNLLLKFASVIHDPVTTTDELIPSGETSSYRSNPFALAEFTLSRKDPEYVGRAKAFFEIEQERRAEKGSNLNSIFLKELDNLTNLISEYTGSEIRSRDFLHITGFGTVIFARRPGDGSAREQAASCQKILGGCANIAHEYATKRYRSNLINWGMIPFTIDKKTAKFQPDDYIYIPGIRKAIENGSESIQYLKMRGHVHSEGELHFKDMSDMEREIILAGCLINYYAKEGK